MQQLDIFNDSRDRVLVNTLAEAINVPDLAKARAAIDALRAEFPADRHLQPALLLIDSLAAEQRTAGTPVADHACALAERHALQGPVTDAARNVLGSSAAAPWLAVRWRALAHRAAALPFEPRCAPAHAAALFINARAWAEASQAVAGIESWRRKPQPLDWMAQAHWHLHGPDATWPLLAELAWLAPPRMPALLGALADTRLNKLQRDFEAFDADSGAGAGADAGRDASTDASTGPATNPTAAWAWWPAWLLVEHALLVAPLDAAQTTAEAAPQRCFKLLQSLLRLERQGRHHDIVALRRSLQGLHPALFAAYMVTR